MNTKKNRSKKIERERLITIFFTPSHKLIHAYRHCCRLCDSHYNILLLLFLLLPLLLLSLLQVYFWLILNIIGWVFFSFTCFFFILLFLVCSFFFLFQFLCTSVLTNQSNLKRKKKLYRLNDDYFIFSYVFCL